jgi:hypothetical protein
MGDFSFYFEMGWQHIISLNALDHQLFILALTVTYTLNEWKQALILVTAFTIGHSITLALSTLNIVNFPSAVIEFLIPCTIVITAITNLLKAKANGNTTRLSYFIAMFFGLVHGLGFAIALKFMLAKDQSLGLSLFAFNVGVEAGQIVLVILLLVLAHIIIHYLKLQRRYWVVAICAGVLIVSLKMAIERVPV